MKRYFVIIAPGHKRYDERVMRTVREYSKVFNLIYIYEKSNEEIEKESSSTGNEILHVQFPLPNQTGFISRFKKINKLNKVLKDFKISGYHIHESGSFGLQIANNLPKKSKIIFDYHDWIPFEINQRLSNGFLYNSVYFLVKVFIRRVVKKISAVVFISGGAKDYFIKEYCNINSFVVPNSREFKSLEAPKFNTGDIFRNKIPDKIEIIWVGNVMRMRQIERLFSLRHKLLEYPSIKSVRLSIWGSLKDKEYAHSLLSHANESSQEEFLKFHGKYSSERDIQLSQDHLSFGIAYGWKEPFDSGLNKISCPTKIYSYGLLGIIGFLESKCSDQLDKIREKDLDIGFSSSEDICLRIKHYLDNISSYNKDSKKLFDFCIDQYAESEDVVKETVKYVKKIV